MPAWIRGNAFTERGPHFGETGLNCIARVPAVLYLAPLWYTLLTMRGGWN